MISFHRRREGPPFLSRNPVRSFRGRPCFHATLRQALYRYLQARPRRRALIPDYVPEGVFAPLRDAGLSIRFYRTPVDLALDAAALRKEMETFRPDLFVYIHHYGLYLEKNLRILGEVLAPGTLVMEDFAHTLPMPGLAPRGDVSLYAFPKLLGVAEGGLLEFKGGEGSDLPYGEPGEAGRILVARMEAALRLEDWIRRWRLPARAQALARRILGTSPDYYPHLLDTYRDIGQGVSEASLRILERVDMEAVSRRRRQLADIYLESLDPRLLLPVPREAYRRQALMAFPVLVDDQDRCHAHLIRRGVQGYRLTDNWWFDPGTPPSALYRRHFLLPLGHTLGEDEVRSAAGRMNQYPGRYLGEGASGFARA